MLDLDVVVEVVSGDIGAEFPGAGPILRLPNMERRRDLLAGTCGERVPASSDDGQQVGFNANWAEGWAGDSLTQGHGLGIRVPWRQSQSRHVGGNWTDQKSPCNIADSCIGLTMIPLS